MFPVRNVQGKPRSAATGSARAQKLSIRTVLITTRVSLRFTPQPGVAARLLLRSDIVHVLHVELKFLADACFPAELSFARWAANLQVHRIAGAIGSQLVFIVGRGRAALDLEDEIPDGQP